MTFYFIGMQNEDLLLKHRFVREKIYCIHAQRTGLPEKTRAGKDLDLQY